MLYHQALQDQKAVREKVSICFLNFHLKPTYLILHFIDQLKDMKKQVAIQDIQIHQLNHETSIHEDRSTAVISLLQQLVTQEKAKANRFMSKLNLYLGDMEAMQQHLLTDESCQLFLSKLQQTAEVVERRKVSSDDI